MFAPNMAALLSYLVPPITGLCFFFTEKDDEFVKYHAAQSIIIGFGWIILGRILFWINPLVSLIAFALIIYGMISAYDMKKNPIPFVSDLAQYLTNIKWKN